MSLTSTLALLAKPFKFIGQAFVDVKDWLPKIIGIAAYSEEEAKVLTPAFVLVVEDVEAIAKYATADAGVAFDAIETIITEISELGGAGAIDPANYAKIITTVNTFIASIHGNEDWTALFTCVKKLIVDFDALGADAKVALAKIESIIAPATPVVQAPAGTVATV